MGFLEVLTIIFVVLKLTSIIDWSWWTIFIPIYIAFVFYATVITIQIKVWKKITKKQDKFMNNFWEDK